MNDIPDVPIERQPRRIWDRVSLIWVIPIAAVAVALAVAWQSLSSQGRVIHVTFEDGAGLVANSTELRFRDVAVGLVEKVGLTEGLKAVEAQIRLSKEISPYVDASAQFWVVRPELTTQGVSGLETVLSGVYIEGSWDANPGEPTKLFKGRPQPPLFRADKPGLQLTLRSSARGQLTDDAPILFRGIEVGRVGKASIDPRGNFAVAEAIIYNPHQRLINDTTRFWDTSGFSISVGAAGASVDFTSIASLVAGGITFDTFVSGGSAVSDGTLFQVYEDSEAARDSIFNQSQVDELFVSVIFDDNISGLSVDAPVELAGLRIGTVNSVIGLIDEETFGDNRVRLNAVLAIQPTRLGLPDEVSPAAALEFLKTRADEGMRAQLASASLLSGGLKVQFVDNTDDDPFDWNETAEGITILPTTQSEIQSGEASVERVLTRIQALPVEELMSSAVAFLDTARAFVASDAIRETPEDLRKLLAAATAVVESDDVRSVAGNINKLLDQVDAMLTELRTEQVTQRLLGAVDAATNAMESMDTSIAGLPELLSSLNTLASRASALPLDQLVTELTGIVATLDELIQTEGVQDLPVQLNATLAEVNAALVDLREGGAVDNVNATLTSARNAADAIASSTSELPALAERASKLMDEASATISGFNKGEALSRDARAALRDIQQAANALAALLRTLERDPSILIKGR